MVRFRLKLFIAPEAQFSIIRVGIPAAGRLMASQGSAGISVAVMGLCVSGACSDHPEINETRTKH